MQRKAEHEENMSGEVYPTTSQDIFRAEATIRSYDVVVGGLVVDKFGEDQRCVELRRQEEELRVQLSQGTSKLANAKIEWVEEIGSIKYA